MVKMSYSKKSKAQLFMSDFIMASVIVIFIIILSVSIWNRNVNSLKSKEERSGMESLVLSISDQLIRSPGIPSDWNKNNVLAIGLAAEDNTLDAAKVYNFTSLDIDKTKNLLGIGNYNFIFRLRNTSETVLVEYGDLPIDGKEVVILRRIVLFEGLPTIMDLGLWK
jgi:hypothetical protein